MRAAIESRGLLPVLVSEKPLTMRRRYLLGTRKSWQHRLAKIHADPENTAGIARIY